jgi:hypothetical protein
MNMTPEIRFSISVLVELCYDMAEDAFGDDPTADHFFMDVLRVAEWLESQGERTPRRPLGTPPPPATSQSGDGSKASQLDRLKAIQAEAEAIMSNTTTDDSLYFSMRDVEGICTTEIDFFDSSEKDKQAKATEPQQEQAKGRYRYQRSTDGCDRTFDIYEPGEERPFTVAAFWKADERTEEFARRVVAALNACDGVPTEALERGVTVARK